MSAKRYSVRVHCIHDGCTEVTRYEASTRKDETRLIQTYTNKWKCTRHSDPGAVLSITNTRRVTTITAGRSERYPNLKGLFWSTGSGVAHGRGWTAWADDFPPGTRIRVTVDVLPPEPTLEATP